jgi:hypothetical protein
MLSGALPSELGRLTSLTELCGFACHARILNIVLEVYLAMRLLARCLVSSCCCRRCTWTAFSLETSRYRNLTLMLRNLAPECVELSPKL